MKAVYNCTATGVTMVITFVDYIVSFVGSW